jgi:hypothetical protein
MIDYERQAITSTARLPRRAGPNGRVVRCEHARNGRPCNNILAVVDGGYLFVTEGRGKVVAPLPAEVCCERCGHHTMLYPRPT